QEPDFPATRVYLTASKLNTEEPSTRCSFTAIITIREKTDLDPRLSIYIAIISSDITLPLRINQGSLQVSLTTLVTRALGLPRNLALLYIIELPKLFIY